MDKVMNVGKPAFVKIMSSGIFKSLFRRLQKNTKKNHKLGSKKTKTM